MEKGQITVVSETKHLVSQPVTIGGVDAVFTRDEIERPLVNAEIRIGNTTFRVSYDLANKVFLNNGIIYGQGTPEEDAILLEVRTAAQELIDWVPEVVE